MLSRVIMKKISLETRLKDCPVPLRFSSPLWMSGGVETLHDLVSTSKHDLRKIRNVGVTCIIKWDSFLEQYGLCLGMTEEEILQYESEDNCTIDVDWEQRRFEIFRDLVRSASEKFVGRYDVDTKLVRYQAESLFEISDLVVQSYKAKSNE